MMKNIGKLVIFKKKKNMGELKEKHIFQIYTCQNIWGYNENGVYTFPVQGYRVCSIYDKEIDMEREMMYN